MFSMLRKVLNVTYLCITLPCSEHVIACSGRVITCRSTLRQIPTPVTHSLSRSKWRLFFPLPEFTLVNNNDEDWQEVQDSAQVREEEEEDCRYYKECAGICVTCPSKWTLPQIYIFSLLYFQRPKAQKLHLRTVWSLSLLIKLATDQLLIWYLVCRCKWLC